MIYLEKETRFTEFDLQPLDERRAQLQAAIGQLTPSDFDALALAVFRYQASYNPLYAQYLALLSCKPVEIRNIQQIPFLPISLFKSYSVKTGNWPSEAIFKSSGTTGQSQSSHHLRSAKWYQYNSRRAFENCYGALTDYCFLGLLPSYLERGDSSLVFMVNEFIQSSRYPQSGFFLNNLEELVAILQDCQNKQIPTILIGVSFALLELAERYPMELSNIIIMETGGMKGRRKELTRAELHDQLGKAFQLSNIHSEYGMTELLSQAYSKGSGRFTSAPTMRVLSRELTDPLSILPHGSTGPLNIIDLANLDSCSFIATDDLGIVHADGRFEVLGRVDHSEMRGCNLLFGG